MLSAQNEELERQKRLMELKKSLLKENSAGLAAKAAAASAVKVTTPQSSSSSTNTAVIKSEPVTKTVTASAGTSPPKEKDSQLKSLLQGLALSFGLSLL